MKLESFSIYQYTLSLKQPLFIRGHELKERRGLIIHLTSQEGGSGFGEAAPLPGLSKENVIEALNQLTSLRNHLLSQPIPPGLESLNGHFENWLGKLQLSPSVRFGFETAVLNLVADLKQRPLHRLISKDCREQIEINGLLQGNIQEVTQTADQLTKDGFKSLKLKLGEENIEEAIAKICAVSDKIYDKALLRLDINQKWLLKQAIHVADEVGLSAVEYIEEPFKDLKDIPEFFDRSSIPVALDESLLTADLKEIKSINGVEVLIIKPTILGGIEKSWRIINQAKAYGLRTVVSSSFESSVGLTALAHLAGCSNRYVAAGLDTLKWFKEDIVKNPLKITKGKINITNSLVNKDGILFNSLKEVT